MALVKYSEIIQGIRGTVAGLVWTNGRTGPFVKKLATPARRRTVKQSVKRAWFAQIRQEWASLTDPQIANWDAFALSPPEVDKNPFGDVIFLSGSAWHMRINMRRLQAGQMIANNAPVSTPETPPSVFTLTVYRTGAVGVDSEFNYGVGDFVGKYAVLHLSSSISAVRQVQTSGYMSIWTGSVSVPGPQIITTEIDAAFGALQVGQKVFGELRTQSLAGIRSTELLATTIVLEEP